MVTLVAHTLLRSLTALQIARECDRRRYRRGGGAVSYTGLRAVRVTTGTEGAGIVRGFCYNWLYHASKKDLGRMRRKILNNKNVLNFVSSANFSTETYHFMVSHGLNMKYGPLYRLLLPESIKIFQYFGAKKIQQVIFLPR